MFDYEGEKVDTREKWMFTPEAPISPLLAAVFGHDEEIEGEEK
jgi:hypothetical protein